MKPLAEPKQFDLNKFLKEAKEFNDENEPIYAECPNEVCLCTGKCREIVVWRKRMPNILPPTKTQER